MRERWKRRRGMVPRPAAPKPLAVPPPEPGLLGWREIRTFLDPGTQVNGKLNFTTPTRIEGRLRGEVRASDLLVIGASGVLHGTVRARALLVAGEVRGEIRGAERVEIQPGGRVTGLVETRTLVIAEGSYFDGDCRMGGAEERALDEPARG
jgi:cytoskeletal protein CcmA (bactofilin family)